MRRRFAASRLRLFWLLPLALLAGFLLGLSRFAESLPREAQEPGRITDGIVVLTGGAGRIDRGFELLEAGLSERLFVSGVYRGVEVDELLDLAQRSPEELRCCIELGYEADDTLGNAYETEAWVAREGIRSLRLVTAAYHMPRARLELSRRLRDVEILVEPVFTEGFREHDWWTRRNSAGLLALEYLKYLVALARAHVTAAVEGLGAGETPS